jgi:hypothetical protein
MRGQFIRGDGLVIPNNISRAGAQMILTAAFRNTIPTFYVALVTGVPSADMNMSHMNEPTIGVNGYTRIGLTRDLAGWPATGIVGAQSYIESAWMTWVPTGAGFDKPIQRLALLGANTVDPGHSVYALSVPFPAPETLLPSTPVDNRKFKYQIFI